jgi:hypothetical protein
MYSELTGNYSSSSVIVASSRKEPNCTVTTRGTHPIETNINDDDNIQQRYTTEVHRINRYLSTSTNKDTGEEVQRKRTCTSNSV